jgi:hypothetical protein
VVLLGAVAGFAWRWWNNKPTGFIAASGTIEATEIRVSFKVSGRVIERPVDEGARVAANQLIARLESLDLEAEVVEPGEIIAAGTPAVTLADLGNIWLKVYIRETDLGRVKLGQKAEIRTDTYPGNVIATLLFVTCPAAHLHGGGAGARDRGHGATAGDAPAPGRADPGQDAPLCPHRPGRHGRPWPGRSRLSWAWSSWPSPPRCFPASSSRSPRRHACRDPVVSVFYAGETVTWS